MKFIYSGRYLRPSVEVYSWILELVTGYSTRSLLGATCPLMYQLRLAEGNELKEEQLAVSVSPGL